MVSCEVDVTGIAAILTALQIGVGLALLGCGLTAPHVVPVRVSLIAAGIVVIFLRIELVAALIRSELLDPRTEGLLSLTIKVVDFG